MQSDDLKAATERLNAGAEVPTVSSSLIEAMWEAMSRIPKQQGQRTLGLGAFARVDPSFKPPSPEQQVAMMTRYALLDALIERGSLNAYMADESLRKKVFAAAASVPCNKNDLGEALAQRLLRESPPDVARKNIEELRQAGCDPDHPKVAEKFIQWMNDNC